MTDSNSTENWLPIKGYENYEISDHGRVKSLNYHRTGRAGILKPGIHWKGYLHVGLYMGRQRKTHKVHVLVLEAFVGPRPSGLVCDHRDASRQNNHVSNLRWITNRENLARSRKCRGIAHPSAKLDEQAVIEIRERCRKGGITQTALAAEYGVTRPLIWFIAKRRIWRHV